MDILQSDHPRRKVFNCIVDDTALVAGVKKTTRDGIRKWINHGAINLLVPLHTLTQLDKIKAGTDRISAEAREAIRWLDDITSNPIPKNAGSVELQGVDESYSTWAEVEQFLLPETLLSMDREDVASLADSLDKNLVVKEDEETMSSTDSLDALSQSPSSRRSTNSSAAPDFSPTSPGKWNPHSQDKSHDSGSDGIQHPLPVPVSLQPLFNHILWRMHADPRAGHSTPDSYVLLTNDPAKQTVAQKFGIRAKRLEQLRDIVAREERDYKNRLLVLRKEATLSESELAARQKAKNNHGGKKTGAKPVTSVPEEDEDEIVFRPRQTKSNGHLNSPQGPKLFDPNTFGRAATAGMSTNGSTNGNVNASSSRNSNHGGNGNESRRGGNRGGSRGNYNHSRSNRYSGGPSSPAKAQASPRVPVDLTQPIDPDSFERPTPGARGGRGGRRRLWEAT